MSEKVTSVLRLIDTANDKDPNIETDEHGNSIGKEKLYSRRMHEILNEHFPDASEHLQIASYAQHIERWVIPRSDFPEGRAGYLNWRKQLGIHHAERTAELMTEAGYGDGDIERVKSLVRKRGIKSDLEAQTLEDIICLVFLKYYFAPFAAKHSEEKIINIVRKTWGKMSDDGHSKALSLELNEKCGQLVNQALSNKQ